MKKITVLLAFCLVFLISSLCSAANITLLPKEQVALGGITIRMSKDAVISMYGQPVSDGNFVLKYGRYGTQFDIQYSTNAAAWVHTVTVSGNNGIATPAGIKVGTPYSDVIRLLGKPHHVFNQQQINLAYYGENDCGDLLFSIENGIVTEIRLLTPKGHC